MSTMMEIGYSRDPFPIVIIIPYSVDPGSEIQ
jgi:hypothetical protein